MFHLVLRLHEGIFDALGSKSSGIIVNQAGRKKGSMSKYKDGVITCDGSSHWIKLYVTDMQEYELRNLTVMLR